jgi:hypothetical protein
MICREVKQMRVGVLSPNLLLNIQDQNMMDADPTYPWPFETAAKRASLLFDKIYLTHDLDATCEIAFVDDTAAGTLRYLTERGLILSPLELGYSSGDDFIKATSSKGLAAELHGRLVLVGNPGIEDHLDAMLLGQPDTGDFDAHDGCHPRGKRLNDPAVRTGQIEYESLLLQRNVAMLREAGISDVAVVGRVYEERTAETPDHPVWKVVLKEMPRLDAKAPWEDVLGFRTEERTLLLARRLRRWIRKIVAERWTCAELEDEIRELIYEYEMHLRSARLSGGSGVLECVITGAAEFVEDIVKLRFGKIAKLVGAVMNQGAKFLEEEAKAPGRELALIPEVRRRF